MVKKIFKGITSFRLNKYTIYHQLVIKIFKIDYVIFRYDYFLSYGTRNSS